MILEGHSLATFKRSTQCSKIENTLRVRASNEVQFKTAEKPQKKIFIGNRIQDETGAYRCRRFFIRAGKTI